MCFSPMDSFYQNFTRTGFNFNPTRYVQINISTFDLDPSCRHPIFLNTQVVNSAFLKPFKYLYLFIFPRLRFSTLLPISVVTNQSSSVNKQLSALKSHDTDPYPHTPSLSRPDTVQTHPLLSAVTVLHNIRLYSLYLPLLRPQSEHPSLLSQISIPHPLLQRERKKERREQFQTRRHKSHVQSSLISLPSRRTSLVHSSVRQCPRPHRDEGFFPLEHEKDCQIIRNPALPTERTA